ncbi:MAG: glycoside hydrolase/phage tail family protein [Methylobacterium mesophilicum]|nr:glycoside hydrolase/phage tail family protein [Methylobacterium mesophilicum]
MAALVLTAAASTFAGSVGAGAVTTALLTGAATAAGAFLDSALVGMLAPGQRQVVDAGGISDLRIQTATEGSPIPEGYGRFRIAGQVIWATRLRMEIRKETQEVGGKGGGGQEVTTNTRLYFANFAIGLCEGPIAGIGRVWADGKPLDLTGIFYRVHVGLANQQPDPLIETKEGAAPAYRNTAYVVFEDLSLERFGNRLPQLEFEVFRRVSPPEQPAVEDRVQGMVVIPGAGEWAYATQTVRRSGRDDEDGESAPENRNSQVGRTDWDVALDDLERTCPNVRSVLLVVAWFGTDLRCGSCEIKPGVEVSSKKNEPLTWRVHDRTRATAYLVSRDPEHADRPVYGGTPSDQAVVQAIRDLKSRGYDVVLYPFVLMDVPPGNSLPNPYGGTGQVAFPWRGRITCHPAAGVAGTVDKTGAAGTQVASFFGTAAAAHITVSIDADSNEVATTYSGPNEWRFRRFVLHYAKLVAAVNAAEAGVVKGLVIGSELRGLTTIRSGASVYPAVTALATLAADCRAVLGSIVKLTYAADWSEYRGHDPADGTGDFFFHLDPLWSSAAIDAVGIDNYMPLSDWREGDSHTDAATAKSIYDADYLRSNIEGGEGYEWYYASQADRDAQVRTPITDGAYGKPWVFRAKDFRSWWLNQHFDRPGGVQAAAPTAWAPQSKPIWFTEFGFPSVDKATNQPNVFVDPKSAESAWPYYSTRQRDDVIQRRGLEALLGYWHPNTGNNPVSAVYGGNMLDMGRCFVWTWDARPYPAWPALDDVWGDGANYPFGHWVQGKFGVVELSALVAHLCTRVGFSEFDVSGLNAIVTGWLRSGPSSPRAQIETLSRIFRFDAVETDGLIRFVPRGGTAVASFAEKELAAAEGDGADWNLTRAQETELPVRATFSYWDAEADYRQTSSSAGRLVGSSERTTSLAAPIVMDAGSAEAATEAWLLERWVERERAGFALPPSAIRLDPADVVALDVSGRSRELRLGRIVDAGQRSCDAVAVERSLYAASRGTPRKLASPRLPTYGPVLLEVLDLPYVDSAQVEHAPWIACRASPWGGAAILDGAKTVGIVEAPATMGETVAPFGRGPVGVWDNGTVIAIRLYSGTLSSRPDADLLAGNANALCIRNADGDWEVLQFASATLVAPSTYELRRLLRGQLGSEHAMRSVVEAGARVVVLDRAVVQADLPFSLIGVERTWRYGSALVPSTDTAWRSRSATARAVALRPWSPVHLRGRRTANGDLVATWIRRTRRDGEWRDSGEVPLAEESERYDVEALDSNGVPVRTFDSIGVPTITYTADQQITDFGAVQPDVVLRVFQLSSVVGRGIPAEASL